MDVCDEAQTIEEKAREKALAGITRYSGVSAIECVECGDDILQARRDAVPGCTMCTDCASMLEVLHAK